MAEAKAPRVNERETRAERFMTDCAEARKRASKKDLCFAKCIQEQGGVFGGLPQLQIMELWKRGLRFAVVVNGDCRAVRAALWGRLRVLAAPMVAGHLNVAQGGYLAASIAVNLPA